jgi:hypothetical protein
MGRKDFENREIFIQFKGDQELSKKRRLENGHFKRNSVFFSLDEFDVGLLEEIQLFSNDDSNCLILKSICIDLPQKNQYFITADTGLLIKNDLITLKMIQIEHIKESFID